MESRAIIELFKTQDMVAADVTRAQARRPVGGGPGRPGRSRPAHGHHHLQRQLRGPAADHAASATSWSWSTGRRKRSSPSSS